MAVVSGLFRVKIDSFLKFPIFDSLGDQIPSNETQKLRKLFRIHLSSSSVFFCCSCSVSCCVNRVISVLENENYQIMWKNAIESSQTGPECDAKIAKIDNSVWQPSNRAKVKESKNHRNGPKNAKISCFLAHFVRNQYCEWQHLEFLLARAL